MPTKKFAVGLRFPNLTPGGGLIKLTEREQAIAVEAQRVIAEKDEEIRRLRRRLREQDVSDEESIALPNGATLRVRGRRRRIVVTE